MWCYGCIWPKKIQRGNTSAYNAEFTATSVDNLKTWLVSVPLHNQNDVNKNLIQKLLKFILKKAGYNICTIFAAEQNEAGNIKIFSFPVSMHSHQNQLRSGCCSEGLSRFLCLRGRMLAGCSHLPLCGIFGAGHCKRHQYVHAGSSADAHEQISEPKSLNYAHVRSRRRMFL